MRASLFQLMRTFVRLYRAEGFPLHPLREGGFYQDFGWYAHCCPTEKRTHALDLVFGWLRAYFERIEP